MNLQLNLIGEVIDPKITVMPAKEFIQGGSGHMVEIAMDCGITLVLDDWQAADLSALLSRAVEDMRNDQPGPHLS